MIGSRKEAEKERKSMLNLKFVVPDMEKTFGELVFAGLGDVTTQRQNGRTVTVKREYHLYSTVQRADDITVELPAGAGEKHFDYEEPVKLVNARIVAKGYSIGGRGYTDYVMTADDMISAKEA